MYYLTLEREDLNKKYEEDILDAEGNVIVAKGDPIIKVFKDEKEAMLAYDNHEIYLQEVIKVRRTMEFNGVKETRLVKATVGRIIFNEAIPQNLGYVDRTDDETKFDYEVGFLVDKKAIGRSSTSASTAAVQHRQLMYWIRSNPGLQILHKSSYDCIRIRYGNS